MCEKVEKYNNYIWTAEKLKSLLNKITSPTVESEHSQISNNIELLFVLDYSQFENVHFLTVGEIIILKYDKDRRKIQTNS